MGHNSLYPASIRINYQSAYGLHSQTIPTAKIALDAGEYKFLKEDLTIIGVVPTLIAAWVAALKVFYPATTTFIDWQAFTYATPTAPPSPLATGAIGVVGTSSIPASQEAKATQSTHTWRTDEFGIFKIVLLDRVIASYDKITAVGNAEVASLHAIVAGANTWMRGRDGGKPQVFLQVAYTLNEKLRRAYRMN